MILHFSCFNIPDLQFFATLLSLCCSDLCLLHLPLPCCFYPTCLPESTSTYCIYPTYLPLSTSTYHIYPNLPVSTSAYCNYPAWLPVSNSTCYIYPTCLQYHPIHIAFYIFVPYQFHVPISHVKKMQHPPVTSIFYRRIYFSSLTVSISSIYTNLPSNDILKLLDVSRSCSIVPYSAKTCSRN